MTHFLHNPIGSRAHMKRDPRLTRRLAWRAKVRRMIKHVLAEQRQARLTVHILPAPRPNPEIHWLPENSSRAPLIPNRTMWDT